MKSQKYACLDKISTMTTPIGIPVWMREIPQGPTLAEELQGING